MGTTWNPSDRANVTLSNGNLSAAMTAAGGVRSAFSASSGKWYWETTFTGTAAPGTGIANASAVLATVWTTPTNAAIAYNGSIYVNNISQGVGPAISTNAVICVAVDFTGALIWFRSGAAGIWNGNAANNPATGVGGKNIAVLGAPLFAIVASSGTQSSWTANFGDSAFTGAAPSGYTAGFGPAASAAQARAMILA